MFSVGLQIYSGRRTAAFSSQGFLCLNQLKNGMKNYHILILILDYGERFLKVAIELYKVQSSLDELKSKKTIILSKNY